MSSSNVYNDPLSGDQKPGSEQRQGANTEVQHSLPGKGDLSGSNAPSSATQQPDMSSRPETGQTNTTGQDDAHVSDSYRVHGDRLQSGDNLQAGFDQPSQAAHDLQHGEDKHPLEAAVGDSGIIEGSEGQTHDFSKQYAAEQPFVRGIGDTGLLSDRSSAARQETPRSGLEKDLDSNQQDPAQAHSTATEPRDVIGANTDVSRAPGSQFSDQYHSPEAPQATHSPTQTTGEPPAASPQVDQREAPLAHVSSPSDAGLREPVTDRDPARSVGVTQPGDEVPHPPERDSSTQSDSRPGEVQLPGGVADAAAPRDNNVIKSLDDRGRESQPQKDISGQGPGDLRADSNAEINRPEVASASQDAHPTKTPSTHGSQQLSGQHQTLDIPAEQQASSQTSQGGTPAGASTAPDVEPAPREPEANGGASVADPFDFASREKQPSMAQASQTQGTLPSHQRRTPGESPAQTTSPRVDKEGATSTRESPTAPVTGIYSTTSGPQSAQPGQSQQEQPPTLSDSRPGEAQPPTHEAQPPSVQSSREQGPQAESEHSTPGAATGTSAAPQDTHPSPLVDQVSTSAAAHPSTGLYSAGREPVTDRGLAHLSGDSSHTKPAEETTHHTHHHRHKHHHSTHPGSQQREPGERREHHHHHHKDISHRGGVGDLGTDSGTDVARLPEERANPNPLDAESHTAKPTMYKHDSPKQDATADREVDPTVPHKPVSETDRKPETPHTSHADPMASAPGAGPTVDTKPTDRRAEEGRVHIPIVAHDGNHGLDMPSQEQSTTESQSSPIDDRLATHQASAHAPPPTHPATSTSPDVEEAGSPRGPSTSDKLRGKFKIMKGKLTGEREMVEEGKRLKAEGKIPDTDTSGY
ncbi:hypothetical protein FRB99_004703 [Tulasnella sp. 403]|nr:hypothetical protein FRB99_004703 [Tulasnella sp. 403]